MTNPLEKWAVLCMLPWESLQANGWPVALPEPGAPSHFLPVFNTRAEAETWANGHHEIVCLAPRMRLVDPPTEPPPPPAERRSRRR